jgi:hypothetical protein
MTCSEVQQVLPELLDVPVNGIFPPDFQSHLKSCPDCSGLVSDLKTISGEARQMTASDEPSPLLWLRIAAQLRAEGLIRDQESDLTFRENSGRPLVRAFPRPRWSFSWLIPVAAVLLVAGTYVVKHQPAPLVAEHKTPAGAAASMPAATPVPDASATTASSSTPPLSSSSPSPSPALDASSKAAKAAAPVPNSTQMAQKRTELEEAAPSADDEQFLSVVSSRAPAMKATYEKQLQAVNADIRESQAYVDQNPDDADARQHLMEAYQQKALLYQIALDRIQ